MHILACSPSPPKLHTSYLWTIREWRDRRWVKVFENHNLMTNFGLTAFASAPGGGYLAPQWLVINQSSTTVSSSTSSSVTVPARVDLAGDTQIVLGVGPTSINQEAVTFTSVTGTGPYTYNLSPNALHAHVAGELVTRQPLATDTFTQVANEVQYDAANFPAQRAQTIGGFSSGAGNYIMQFLLTGAQALITIPILGLADNNIVGQGNLHNELVSGYVHTTGVDLEIDVSITLSNI